jgi:Nif-specific regulatory protein
MLFLKVIQGLAAGTTFELAGEVVTIGRAPSNDVVLADLHVSGEHARIVLDGERVTLTDLRSTNGTAVERRGDRLKLGSGRESMELESGDLIELGNGDGVTSMRVTIADDRDAHVVSMRRLDDVEPAAAKLERDPSALSKLYAVQKRIGAATDLDQVLIEVADAIVGLIANVTHVTVVLKDDDHGGDSTAYVPVMTRVRQSSARRVRRTGQCPSPAACTEKSSRSAPRCSQRMRRTRVGQTESLMGASIRSTIGVPLWRATRFSACCRPTTGTRRRC